MNFNNGNDNNNNKNNDKYVRAVRGGKYSLLSFASIYKAYLDCRRRKRGTVNALRFEFDLLDGLTSLAVDLQKGTYAPSRSVCFINRSPKLREIFASDFRDRIVHHLVVRELEKQWEPRFIFDSYACRKDKGIHAAVKRLQGFMMKATASRKKPAYFLQLDIRSFFMSIDKHILFSIFQGSGISDVMGDLLARIIFHDCTENYYFRGNRGMLKQIPPHKSLFKVGPDKGLPIGNLTSQFFANVYLNELDQFVKHTLKCRYYIRYVDDFILISQSPAELAGWRERIEGFLKDRLALEIKAGDRIRRVSEGADFLGYIVRPDYILVRNRVVNNLKYKLALYRERIVSIAGKESRPTVNGMGQSSIVGRDSNPDNGKYRLRDSNPDSAKYRLRDANPDNGPGFFPVIDLEPETIGQLCQTLASYMGHFKHANSHRLRTSLFEKNAWLNVIFTIKGDTIQERLKPPRNFRTFRGQWRFFKSRLKGILLFVGMGRFIELYNEDAIVVQRICGLRLSPKTRGMGCAVGVPISHARKLLARVLTEGHSAAWLEDGEAGRYVRCRYVRRIVGRDFNPDFLKPTVVGI